jgi:hypothetical protein
MQTAQQHLEKKLCEIERKIAELEALSTFEYKTNGKFYYNPKNQYTCYDIHRMMDDAELIHIYSFITNKSKDYTNAGAEIGLQEFPFFKWGGYPAEYWQHDIKLRFALKVRDTELQRLQAMQRKIQLVSYLHRRQIIQLLLELKSAGN